MMDRGWIALWRKSMTDPVWASEPLWRLWTWCLLKANHKSISVPMKTGKGETIVHLQPGQFIMGRESAAKELRWKPSSIRNRISKLESMNLISRKTDTHWTVVTICNWGKYQEVQKEKGQAKDRQRTGKGQAKDTDNNDNNYNNKEKTSPPKATPTESLELAKRLGRHIFKLNPKNRFLQNGTRDNTFQRWAVDLDRAIRIDNRTAGELEVIIDWAHQDDFWFKNIESGKAVREKFDRMTVQMNDDKPKNSGGGQHGCMPSIG